MLSSTSRVFVLMVVVLPLTVRFPEMMQLPSTSRLFLPGSVVPPTCTPPRTLTTEDAAGAGRPMLTFALTPRLASIDRLPYMSSPARSTFSL